MTDRGILGDSFCEVGGYRVKSFHGFFYLVLSSLLPSLLALVPSKAALAAPYTDQNAAQNVNFNRDGSDPSKYFGQWPGHQYFASPNDWRDVGVYQLITDRFRDGDPTNNEGKYGGYNVWDVGARHGGDFKGLKEQLGYIKALGYDAIWISPVFQNRYNSYHGYGQIDFTLIDDRQGTLQDFRDMVSEAHRLGMYVIVDIVVNHMENLYYFEGHPNDGAPFHFHDGEYKLIPRDPNVTYTDFKVDNTFYNDGTYSDVYGYDGKVYHDPGHGSYWFSDFHHNGDLGNYDDPWQNHLGKIYGILDDLRTTHPRVQDKIIAMTKSLISSTDIDGIRMDTPMQVPLYFFKRWAPAVKAHAKSLGKNNFFIFAEFYCPRERSATMVGRGRTVDQWGQPYTFIDGTYSMDAGVNYDLYFKFVNPSIKDQQNGITNAKADLDQDLLAYDFYNPVRNSFDYVMLNFINNHDQWRMNNAPDGYQKTLLGSSFIAFWPGIPLFYYGDEQNFATAGSGIDGKSREDFMTSKAWFDLPFNGQTNAAVYDNFNMTHSQFLAVQKVMNVRKQYFALRDTQDIQERWAQTNNTNGIYAFTRKWGDQKNWALVAFNTWSGTLSAGGSSGTLNTGWNEGDTIVNALNPSERYTLGGGGVLSSLSLNGYETKVFVRSDNWQPLNPAVNSISVGHDAVVASGNKEISLSFSEPMNTDSLKGAVSYDGQRLSTVKISEDTKTLTFTVNVTAGIHKIRVNQSVSSQAGKTLFADFVSRFRSGGDNNPIIHLQKDPLVDSSLVESGNPDDQGQRTLTFHHKADGAKLYRVSIDNGNNWGPWQSYQSTTTQTLPATKTATSIMVQYWADGSAAYFSQTTVP